MVLFGIVVNIVMFFVFINRSDGDVVVESSFGRNENGVKFGMGFGMVVGIFFFE